jgi:hypothetical protein
MIHIKEIKELKQAKTNVKIAEGKNLRSTRELS